MMVAKSKLTADPKRQLDSFPAKYDPAIAAFARRVLVKVRKWMPVAVAMVYDNYNGLVVGFGPNDKASLAISRSCCFPVGWGYASFRGWAPGPQRRLQGEGRVVRHIRLEDFSVLDDPYVQGLMNLALHRAKVPLDPPQNRRQLIIKSAKQRPRKSVSKSK